MQNAHCICELCWVKIMLRELGFKTQEPMRLNCDNKAASNIDHDFEIDRSFIKKPDHGIIYTLFVKTGTQLEDVLTKKV